MARFDDDFEDREYIDMGRGRQRRPGERSGKSGRRTQRGAGDPGSEQGARDYGPYGQQRGDDERGAAIFGGRSGYGFGEDSDYRSANQGDIYSSDYQRWREAQLNAFDEDFRAFQEERAKRFSADFEEFRKNRIRDKPRKAQGGGGESKTADT